MTCSFCLMSCCDSLLGAKKVSIASWKLLRAMWAIRSTSLITWATAMDGVPRMRSSRKWSRISSYSESLPGISFWDSLTSSWAKGNMMTVVTMLKPMWA